MSDQDWIERARVEGQAPTADAQTPRPWPVVLLTALGAWLAVPPFLLLFATLFGGDWDQGPMPYVEGIALVALAVVLLRKPSTPLFLEQAAVPLLPTGLACLGYGLVGRCRLGRAAHRRRADRAAEAGMAAVAAGHRHGDAGGLPRASGAGGRRAA